MFYKTDLGKIYNGDCLEVMKTLIDDNSITSIITDPPYALEFMGKGWDKVLPSINIWKECLRISKPGAMLLAFGGTRTYHRLTCDIEDAGWEIRDCLMWVYGSGFPKSTNIFKQLNRKLDKEEEEKTISMSKIFDGYGTALKPAYEPIVLAMKPLDGTYAGNILKWGVGGLNIDGSRIDQGRWPANFTHDGSEEVLELFPDRKGWSDQKHSPFNPYGGNSLNSSETERDGIYKGYNDQGSAARFFYCAKASRSEKNLGCEELLKKSKSLMGEFKDNHPDTLRANFHPTVKPLNLIKYLINLISPPVGAIIMDPFLGSGTTSIACEEIGVNWIGIEKQPEYCEISKYRISHISKGKQERKKEERKKNDVINTFFK